MKEAEGVDVAGSLEWTIGAKRCHDRWNGPRTDANDQKLVSPGPTSRIINVGTRTALSRTPTPAGRDSTMPLVLRDL